MWIGWVESNFTNPTVTVSEKIWIIHLRELIMHSFVCRPLWTKLCQHMWYHKRTTLHWLCTQIFTILNFSWISIVLLIKYNHKCMHIHLSPNIPKFKRRGKIHFHEKYNFVKNLCTVPWDSCTVVTSQILERVPPERATYTKLMKTLKNHISWLDYPNLPKLLLLGF